MSSDCEGRVLDVFWCHRLVPESGLASLPFWPSPQWASDHRDEVKPVFFFFYLFLPSFFVLFCFALFLFIFI